MRRPPIVVATAVALALLPACSDEGDSEAFCDRLADTQTLGVVLARLDTSDPTGAEATIREAVEDFRSLEADAPGEIRDDVARLRQGVELVLGAVEDNPDDLPAARQAIAGELDELSGLAQSGEAVVGYARDECGLALDDGGTTTTGG